MADLPTEVISQILSFLPVKSLLRFKCVSKSWHSLIINPNFIKLHLNQALISTSDRHLLLNGPSVYSADLNLNLNLRRNHQHLSFLELNPPFKFSTFDFLGSCNGVFCMSNSSKTDIFLYNPLTRSHFIVPKIPIPKVRNNNGKTVFGFGYDSMSDDYKLLRIVQGFEDDYVPVVDEIKVFSLKNDAWNTSTIQGITSGIPYSFGFRDRHGCLVNEVLHYMMTSKELDANYVRFLVGCIDLRTESFSVIDCPRWEHDESTDSMSWELYLSELSGCLSVINLFYVEDEAQYPNDLLGYRADLWVMKEYGKKESWVRLFSMHFSELDNHWMVMPIVYSNDGKRVMVHKDCTWFEWYDLASDTAERFTIDGLPDEFLDARVFVGSLVSFGDKQKQQE